MNEVEGIGTAVTGGLIARAIEPAAGEAGKGGSVCLNCGAELVGEYCHHCGQQGHVHRSLKAFWHDLLHGVLHFEGKIWRTLPLLAWRPGDLTRRYIEGERARFVSPLALFLFSVFLMFATFSAIGGPALSTSQTNRIEATQEIEREREAIGEKLARLQTQRAEAVTAKGDVAAIERDIAAASRERDVLGMATGEMPADRSAIEGLELEGMGWFDQAYRKAKENPSLLLYKLQSNAYKFSWALIPISVPFVWLLFFWKRQYRVYDHVVFVTYSIAFVTLMAVAFSVAGMVGLPSALAVWGIAIIPPLHMYRQLRSAYALSRAGAIWRTFCLLIFAFIAATLYFAMLLAMGVLG